MCFCDFLSRLTVQFCVFVKWFVGFWRMLILRCVLQDDGDSCGGGDLLGDLEDALLNQRHKCSSGAGLIESGEKRFQGRLQQRLAQLEGL